MVKNIFKKYFITAITTIVAIVGFYSAYNRFYYSYTPLRQTINIDLENKLLNTAWVSFNQTDQETDFEIDFRNTKENDPLHQSYDYEDYLHQRPGGSGYWKVVGNTITVIGNPSDLPPVIYTNVNFTENILEMTDQSNNAKLRFKRIITVPE